MQFLGIIHDQIFYMEGSIQASQDYQLDCQCLNSCFFGDGAVNKQRLVELLTNRNSQQLKIIRQKYYALYNQDFLCALSEIRSNNAFANAVYLRASEPHERDAEILRNALSGWRVDLNILIEVVCTRSSSDLHYIKQAYRTRYRADIEHDVAQKTSGNFKQILVAVLNSSRFYGTRVDISMAMCDAKTLYEAVENGNSVDWKTIITVMSERNNRQIKAILTCYKELYGHEFSKFLKCNKCGKYGKDFGIVIRGIQFPDKFFAKKLRQARGIDAREALARIVITRLEIDIKEINNVFAAKTGSSIGNRIRREFNVAGGSSNHVTEAYGLAAEFLLGLLKNH